MCYIVTYGPWHIKTILKMIHFNIIIKSMRHFMESVGVCWSVSGPFFTRHPIYCTVIVCCPVDTSMFKVLTWLFTLGVFLQLISQKFQRASSGQTLPLEFDFSFFENWKWPGYCPVTCLFLWYLQNFQFLFANCPETPMNFEPCSMEANV